MTATINASTTTGIVQSADTSGELALQSNGTTKLTVSSSGVNIGQFAGGTITSGTAVASTSGTAIGFTSIPSWVKKVTFILNGVGTSGTAGYLIQIGSGSYTSSGYVGGGGRCGNASGTSTSSTAGFLINTAASGGAKNIILTVSLMNTSFGYTCAGSGFSGSESNMYTTGGSVTLSGVMDRIQITTTNGTDTFTAGTINIQYEG